MKKRYGKIMIFAKPIKCSYWKPGFDFINYMCKKLKNVRDGDIIVFSEKALAVALGQVIDESKIKPSIISKILTYIIMRIVWGYILGPLVKLKRETLDWIRRYPVNEGASHKQIALIVGGILQALKPSSEAGIDTSNLPYTYASFPLEDCSLAEKIRVKLSKRLGKNIAIMIVDSDRTYVLKKTNLAWTSRKTCIDNLTNLGVFSYIIGRFFKKYFKPKATPIMYSGYSLPLPILLEIAEIADRLRGYGAGRTVFEMAQTFNTTVNGVTWTMLEKIPHYPIVIVRLVRKN